MNLTFGVTLDGRCEAFCLGSVYKRNASCIVNIKWFKEPLSSYYVDLKTCPLGLGTICIHDKSSFRTTFASEQDTVE